MACAIGAKVQALNSKAPLAITKQINTLVYFAARAESPRHDPGGVESHSMPNMPV